MSLLFIQERVQGISHVVCEDYAQTRYEDGYALFAVADGHGDPACARSSVGSQIAVESAFGILRKLAKGILTPANEKQQAWEAELLQEGSKSALLGYLAASIVRDWNKGVDAHWEANPLSDEEVQELGDKGRRWAYARDPHLYGTTLLAGLLLPNMIVVLRKGDGACVAVYDDARVDDVVPEDARCVGNVTTSMCDPDAAQTMQFEVIDRRKNNPVACFVATDGVDKSLIDEEGVADFFRGVVVLSVQNDEEQTKQLLRQTLEELRDQGAGDDTSVAGFVSVDRAAKCVEILQSERSSFTRELEEQRREAKLVSMERKHSYLLRREQEIGQLRDQLERLEAEVEDNRQFMEDYERTERELEELRGSVSSDQASFGDLSQADEAGDQGPASEQVADDVLRPASINGVPTGEQPPAMQEPRGYDPASAGEHAADRDDNYGRERVNKYVYMRQGSKKRTGIIVAAIAAVAVALVLVAVFVVLPTMKKGGTAQDGTSSSAQQEVATQQDGQEQRSNVTMATAKDIESIQECLNKLKGGSSGLSDNDGEGLDSGSNGAIDAETLKTLLVERVEGKINDVSAYNDINDFADACIRNVKYEVQVDGVHVDEGDSSKEGIAKVKVTCGDAREALKDNGSEDEGIGSLKLVDNAIKKLSATTQEDLNNKQSVFAVVHVSYKKKDADSKKKQDESWKLVYGADALVDAIAEASGFDEVCSALLGETVTELPEQSTEQSGEESSSTATDDSASSNSSNSSDADNLTSSTDASSGTEANNSSEADNEGGWTGGSTGVNDGR